MDTVDASFQMVQIIIFIGFALVIGGIIFSFVKQAATWSSNKQKPRLRVPAQVVGKRTGSDRRKREACDYPLLCHS
ncbi:DUF2500 domain-containing protein [Sporolactobacillus terrae]|uniref:DUF2500 domain-containing protein n=1 Tax=Sporolactobacillus terrae TaxID=269673 RepID=UPI001CBF377A|nr:DUF2500 domain-containing protein [Sporolactobacillus terrae]UAK18088.1 DUF2500 domain-containing protein [Sporolactobacillus terrae]